MHTKQAIHLAEVPFARPRAS